PAGDFALRGRQYELRPAAAEADELGFQPHVPAAVADLGGVGLGHLLVIDDARLGDEQPGDPGHVRLALADLLGRQPPDALQAVGEPAALQLGQGRQLALVRGDDDLAAALVGDPVVGAVAVHQLPAVGAVLGLERAGLVVEAGVDDPAVVPGL